MVSYKMEFYSVLKENEIKVFSENIYRRGIYCVKQIRPDFKG